MTIDFPITADIPALKGLWSQCFGDPEPLINGFFAAGFSPEHCRCLKTQGEVAAALYWFDAWQGKGRLAYVYAVATAPVFQGRGFCRALMEDTHRLLKEAGYAGAMLVPGGPGLFAMYESMGYQPFGGIREFTCLPAEKPLALERITPAQYAQKRRALMQSGGVIQEGAALAWLECFGAFYAGEDFLLAGALDKDTLLVQELLGNTDAAPGILAALGAKQGRFRVPGQEKPFAMYYPLNRQEPPAYFGLALD